MTEITRHDPVPGQFSRVVVHGNVAYLAGIVAEDLKQDVAGQCRQVFRRIDALLECAGTSRSRLLSLTVYIKSFDDYDAYRAAFGEWIDPDNLPARATIQADLRDPRILIEIMGSAAL